MAGQTVEAVAFVWQAVSGTPGVPWLHLTRPDAAERRNPPVVFGYSWSQRGDTASVVVFSAGKAANA